MAALLVGIAILSIFASVAVPLWRTMIKREKEQELIFRGQQYARAISLYQRRFPGALPPNLDVLVEGRFLRKKFKDPMSKDGEFQMLFQSGGPWAGVQRGQAGAVPGRGSQPSPGQVQNTVTILGSFSGGQFSGSVSLGGGRGVVGVASTSTDKSLKIYNGATVYNQWQFIYTPTVIQPGRGARGAGRGDALGQGTGFGPGGRQGTGPGMGTGRGEQGGRGGPIRIPTPTPPPGRGRGGRGGLSQ